MKLLTKITLDLTEGALKVSYFDSGRGLQIRNCLKNGSDFKCVRVLPFPLYNQTILLDKPLARKNYFGDSRFLSPCTTQSRPTPI